MLVPMYGLSFPSSQFHGINVCPCPCRPFDFAILIEDDVEMESEQSIVVDKNQASMFIDTHL